MVEYNCNIFIKHFFTFCCWYQTYIAVVKSCSFMSNINNI